MAKKKEKAKNILSSWAYSDLAYFGRITVIKTLTIPLLVQILTVLPNPPAQDMKEIQDIFYRFLWDGKAVKMKRNVIITMKKGEGGGGGGGGGGKAHTFLGFTNFLIL